MTSRSAGREQPQTVPEVSGEVVDVFTGEAGRGRRRSTCRTRPPPSHDWNVGTDNDGKFKFTSTPEKPIVTRHHRLEGREGQIAELYRRATRPTPASPSTSHASSMSPTASPQRRPRRPPPAVTDRRPSPAWATDAARAGQNEKESGLSWILIGIGGVLVLLGIGAIVLLFLRKRDDGRRRRR